MSSSYIEIKNDRDAPVVKITTFLPWAILLLVVVIMWAVSTIINQFFPVNGTLAVAILVLVGIIFGTFLLKVI